MAQSSESGLRPLTIVVEKLRLLAYLSFWVVVLVGMFLTKYVTKLDLEHTLLTKVFGYNNICVYFDHPPSNHVLPFLWAITLVLLMGYMLGHWLQMRAAVEQGHLSRKAFKALSAASVFEAFTMIAFSTIFAVSPTGWNETLYIHTVPFFLLQIGLLSLAISKTVYGFASGYWRRLGFPEWMLTGAKVYCVVFICIVAFKIPAATNAMAGQPWWEQTPFFTSVAYVFDRLFLICAAIVPMGLSAYLAYFKTEHIEIIQIQSSFANNAPRPRPVVQSNG